MPKEPFDPELDDLLREMHSLLDEETPEVDPADVATDLENMELELEKSHQVTAADVEIDYARFYDEPIPVLDEPEPPAPAPTPQEASVEQPKYWTQTQRLPKHVAKLAQNQEQAYADWLYEQDHRADLPPKDTHHRSLRRWPEDQPPEDAPAPKKKRHVLRNLILFLILLAVILTAVVVFVLPRQPVAAAGLGERKDGAATILLAGMDQGGMRTDTMMLLSVGCTDGGLSLVSLPRDTLINGGYTVPKLNSVFAANNGGQEGIEMLLTRVGEIIGFVPDGYMLIQLDAFVELVDTLGGVTFDVPVDMYYNDPGQDLYIDLKAGTQTLTGEEAMGVVRFRSGYADADLGRIQVQRALLSAIFDQVVSPAGIAKSPALLQILLNRTTTNLDAANLLWLGKAVLAADRSKVETVTLPGNAQYIGDGSYYILDPASVAQTVNAYCNPYTRDVTVDDLSIRTG